MPSPTPRLRSLQLDHNRINLAGIPPVLLSTSPSLAELSLHGRGSHSSTS